MLFALEQVSVINDLKGTKECRKGSQAIVHKNRVLVPPQGIYIIIYLWVLQELRPPQGWRMEWWCWPSWLQSTKAWTLLTNSMLNSSLLKALHEYACTLSLKLPQFCCSLRHCFGKDPQCSPYLLQLIITPSFSQSLAWLCLLAQHLPRDKSSLGITMPLASFIQVPASSCESLSFQPRLRPTKGINRKYLRERRWWLWASGVEESMAAL